MRTMKPAARTVFIIGVCMIVASVIMAVIMERFNPDLWFLLGAGMFFGIIGILGLIKEDDEMHVSATKGYK